MPKMSIDDIMDIAPAAKTVTFKAEKNGVECDAVFYIYPFTVEEKAKVQQFTKEIKEMDENSEEYMKVAQDYNERTVFMILQKSIDGLTMRHVKNLPTSWYTKFIETAMTFEGISEEQIEALRKKQVEQQNLSLGIKTKN